METSLIVAVALLMAGWVAMELRVSSAIVEILAGMLLAWFITDMARLGWLSLLANIGMLALMFVAGFDVDLRSVRRTWRRAGLIGSSSFLFPLTGLFLATWLVLDLDTVPALLVAIGLSTTSLALVYQDLRDHDRLRTRGGQTTLAAASLVDVLSMVSLALLLGETGWGTAILLLVLLMSLFSLPPLGSWFFRRYGGGMVEPELRFLIVVIVGMGFMAEELQTIHPAVVAFAVGIALGGVMQGNKPVKRKLKGLVFGLFAPVFFLQAGTQIDLHELNTEFVLPALLLLVLAVGLKYFGTVLAIGKRVPRKSRRRMGILFNYRLTFGIISANVGLRGELISESLYAAMLLVIVISAALPSLHERWLAWRGA